jgi:DeoR family transcriptional regulator, glycerol-3-phosphate regulon repressor
LKPSDRHHEIVRLVHKAGEVSVDDLADQLGVSRETIRRDLSDLDALGRLRKFHGGARMRSSASAEPSAEGPFALRMGENTAAKRKIAYKASTLLAPGDSLFIDTGTTTLMLAEALVELPSLVVITNSWRIAATMAANADHKVFLLGGAYGSDAGETLGQFAVEQIRKFRARHAFLTVGAVDQSTAMDFDAQETEIAQAMIERVDTVTVLADSSKFGQHGIFEVARWGAIGRLVSDQRPPLAIESAIKSAGTEIVTP